MVSGSVPGACLSVEPTLPTGLELGIGIWYPVVLAFSPGLSHFQVPGLLDFFSPGTTRPRDLQDL